MRCLPESLNINFYRSKLRVHYENFFAKSHEVKRDWFVIDAADLVLGKVPLSVPVACAASISLSTHHTLTLATSLSWSMRVNCGLPATKRKTKPISATPATLAASQETNFAKMQSRFPGRALEKRLKACYPKVRWATQCTKKLKVYATANHPHVAQQPKELKV